MHPSAHWKKALAQSYAWWPVIDKKIEKDVMSYPVYQVNCKMTSDLLSSLGNVPDHC